MRPTLLALILLVTNALAQQGLSGEPNRFALDMIGQVGGIVVACPAGVSNGQQMMCVSLNRGFDDLRPEWDSWIIMHLPTFGGTVSSKWSEGGEAFSATYKFPGYLLEVRYLKDPKDDPRMILIQSNK